MFVFGLRHLYFVFAFHLAIMLPRSITTCCFNMIHIDLMISSNLVLRTFTLAWGRGPSSKGLGYEVGSGDKVGREETEPEVTCS